MHERPSPRLFPAALLAALLITVLAAGTALTRAQAPDPVQSAVDSESADATAGDQEQGPGSAPPDGTAAGQPAGPLEDYEASEQISEDLSVSFPVDI